MGPHRNYADAKVNMVPIGFLKAFLESWLLLFPLNSNQILHFQTNFLSDSKRKLRPQKLTDTSTYLSNTFFERPLIFYDHYVGMEDVDVDDTGRSDLMHTG